MDCLCVNQEGFAAADSSLVTLYLATAGLSNYYYLVQRKMKKVAGEGFWSRAAMGGTRRQVPGMG